MFKVTAPLTHRTTCCDKDGEEAPRPHQSISGNDAVHINLQHGAKYVGMNLDLSLRIVSDPASRLKLVSLNVSHTSELTMGRKICIACSGMQEAAEGISTLEFGAAGLALFGRRVPKVDRPPRRLFCVRDFTRIGLQQMTSGNKVSRAALRAWFGSRMHVAASRNSSVAFAKPLASGPPVLSGSSGSRWVSGRARSAD